MSYQPLVSVIIIFLNGEQFIEEAIASVLAQTYSNWELLLVDDGSTDGSSALAQRYAQQHPEQIRYLEHPGHQNCGKSTSRNLGIRYAKGEYLALLDADDIYLPEKLAQQVKILELYPDAAMVYGSTQYWYSWMGKPDDTQRDFLGNLGVQPNTLFNPPLLVTQFLRDSGIVPCTCGLLVRRRFVEAVGGFDETIQDLYEDQVFIFKLCLKAPVFVEAGTWDKYRQRPNSSWHTSLISGEEYQARRIFLQWLKQYLVTQGYKNTEAWQLLQVELRTYQYPVLHRLSQKLQRTLEQWKGGAKSIGKWLLPTGVVR